MKRNKYNAPFINPVWWIIPLVIIRMMVISLIEQDNICSKVKDIHIDQQWIAISKDPLHTPFTYTITDMDSGYVQYQVACGTNHPFEIRSQLIKEFIIDKEILSE